MFDVIVTCLQLLSTIVIGLIVAYIAYQQWRTNHYRLKLDLYEKRYEVYSAVITIFKEALLEDNYIASKHIGKYILNTAPTDFLFGKEVNDYLRKVGVRLQPRKPMEPPDNPKEREKWVRKQIPIVRDIFKPYMDFTKLNREIMC